MRECIEWERVVAEVANIEYSFGIGEIQARKVRIEASIGGAKVWYASRGAYARACLTCVSSNACLARCEAYHDHYLSRMTVFNEFGYAFYRPAVECLRGRVIVDKRR